MCRVYLKYVIYLFSFDSFILSLNVIQNFTLNDCFLGFLPEFAQLE